MTNNELWQAVLGELELTISKPSFTTWFKYTRIVSFENGVVVIGVPNNFTQGWLEKKHQGLILKILNTLTGRGVATIAYRVENAQPVGLRSQENVLEKPLNLDEIKLKDEPKPQMDKYGLNPKYTFANFIVGKGSELAHAAAQAVAVKPGVAYNPLFIYGGVGLGKTHLLQAVGHECIKNNKNFKFLSVTCEKFTSDFVHAVRTQQLKDFKDRYRGADLLLIDDVQFIGGKEGSQEELFHTFNELHQFNKQMVLTSDRQPKEIPSLEARLLSRLQWGMIVDIGSPDFETRVAILGSKCKEKGVQLEEAVINYVATTVQSNVRELEGALNKLIAYSQFKNIQMNVATAKALLQTMEVAPQKKNILPKHVVSIVANYFDLRIDELLGESREKRLAVPRQISMFLLRDLLKVSFPSIGNELGGRDHTTAIHACDKIKKELDINFQLKQDVDNIRQRLYL